MAEYSNLEKIRIEKIEEMRAEGIEPYPSRAERTHTNAEAIAAFEKAEREAEGGVPAEVHATLTGRIRAMRIMGKVAFSHIEDGSGKIQLFLRINEVTAEGLQLLTRVFDLGDFIQASGVMMRTKAGEVSLQVHKFSMLAKAVSPLPADKDVEQEDGTIKRYAALEDMELRARQRYADLAVNPETRTLFRKRAGIVKAIRRFLDDRDFLEVETPILQPIYGGAAAKPFKTYHEELKRELYLRISFELYLKRLLVGNLERVYEIGRDFRNEGVSFKHNPEFTQLEFYWAYADYLKVMALTEQMIAYVAEQVNGSTKVIYQGKELDFAPPWNRLEMRQGLLDVTGIDITSHPTAKSLYDAINQYISTLEPEKKPDKKPKPDVGRGKLIDYLVGEFLEPTMIQPTFLYNYPRDISPLAKSMPNDPLTVERFEGYVAGFELCNAFTELNDPLDQEQRFIEMGRTLAADDEENNPLDEDYLRAMRYGMPPNGGFGMGIDRLTMLLTDKHSIREILLFPHLRSEE